MAKIQISGQRLRRRSSPGALLHATPRCDTMTNMETYNLPRLICNRCQHGKDRPWHPRSNNKPPRCPNCGSPYWDRPRQRSKKSK